MSQTSNLLTASHLMDRNVNVITGLAAEAEDLSKSLQLLFFWFREGDLLFGTTWRKWLFKRQIRDGL